MKEDGGVEVETFRPDQSVKLLISALINPIQSKMKVVLSVRVDESRVHCHLDSLTVTLDRMSDRCIQC